MHQGQPNVLLILSECDGLPQSVLAKTMAVKPATVSAMVKRMEKAGYVARKRDAEDERISNVYLTDAGRVIGEELSVKQNEMEKLVFKGFSVEEKESMRDFLERVLININE